MGELVIKKHNFETAKKRLKQFSEIKDSELEIKSVKTEGDWFGLGDHNVTGREFNERIEVIQKNLININSASNRTKKEFREIYKALDALDKDYITGIVASVKAVEKTSNDVRMQQDLLNEHNKELQKQQNKLDSHQSEIDDVVDYMRSTVMILSEFKEKFDNIEHLTDIDEIWLDYKALQKEIQNVSKNNHLLQDSLSKAKNDIALLENKNIKTENLLAKLDKKIKYAYLIACGSIIITALEFILMFR